MEVIENWLYQNDIVLMLPEIYLSLVVLLLLVLGVSYDKYILSLGKSIAVVVTELGILGTLFMLILCCKQYGLNVYIFNYQIYKNELSIFLSILVLIGVLVSLLFLLGYIKRDTIDEYEYVLLVLLAAIGLVVMLTANDLLVIYLGIELQSLCLYILATFKQESSGSTEAGLKYVVMGAVSSGILLFGISLLYGFTGLINLTDLDYLLFLINNDEGRIIHIIAPICILIGLLFKVGAAPFHMWLPDVYEGSPTIVTSFFAIVPKIAVYGLIGKVYFTIFMGIMSDWVSVLVYCALLSLLVGSLGALYQKTLKRLIAYSAIGHTGFILLGFTSGSLEGLESVYLYVLIYMVLVINMFGILLSLRKQDDYRLLKLLGNCNQLYNTNKILVVSFSLLLFSMAGVPPLAGFFGKLYIFFSVVKEGQYVVALLGVLISVIGAVYYIRLIKIMFFNIDRKWGFYFPVDTEIAYVITYSTVFGLFFCLYSSSIILLIHDMVLAYFY